MHAKLRDGAVVVLNSTVFQADVARDRFRVFAVPATTMAAELGNPLGASMVITGAYSAITGLVGIDACVEAMRDSVPPYRQQHVAANEAALRAGFAAVDPLSAPAWDGVPA
jgi:Pyruvate/2-oxoacid:ferredoxin oxidoreductase gamma subunit